MTNKEILNEVLDYVEELYFEVGYHYRLYAISKRIS